MTSPQNSSKKIESKVHPDLESISTDPGLAQESTANGQDRPTDDAALRKLLQQIEMRRPRESFPRNETETSSNTEPPRLIRASSSLRRRKLIGRGGLGVVYRIHDIDLGRELALKIVQPHVLQSPSGIDRFVRERRITAKLTHPSIPPVHQCGELKDGRPYYVMRFIRGHSLHRILTKRAEPPRDFVNDKELLRLLDSFERICDAVQYAHDAGIIHRDIKPANIVWEKHGASFLVDWGLAREKHESETTEATDKKSRGNSVNLTQNSHRIGSPLYMSPEQATGNVEAHGPATDIYGLGATLFHILTGLAPHAATKPQTPETKEEMFSRIATTPVPSAKLVVPQVPAALASICGKALEQDPAKRYSSVQDLHDDLVRWRRNEVVTAHANRYTSLEKIQLFSFRNLRLVTATAVGLLLLIIVSSTSAALVLDQNRKLDLTVTQRDEKIVELNEVNSELDQANQRLQEETDRLERALEIGFQMLNGIETNKYTSVNDVYVDVIQNGLKLPDEKRDAMLPLYNALMQLQYAHAAAQPIFTKPDSLASVLGRISQAGDALNVVKHLDLALEELNFSIRQSDKLGLVWLLRAQLRMEYYNVDAQEVIEDWDRAVELLPTCSAAFSGKGWCLIRQQKFDLAFEDLTKAVELDPGNEFAHYGLGELLYDRKDFASAVEHYRLAIELPRRYVTDSEWRYGRFDDLGMSLWGRASERHNQGDSIAAIEDYLEAIEFCNTGNRLKLWEDTVFLLRLITPTPELVTRIGMVESRRFEHAKSSSFLLTRDLVHLLALAKTNQLTMSDVDAFRDRLTADEVSSDSEITDTFVARAENLISDCQTSSPEDLVALTELLDVLQAIRPLTK